MRRSASLCLATLLLAVPAEAKGPVRPDVAVMVGGIADLDACRTVEQVTGLNPRGDNFLSVRSRPSTRGRELARLRSGRMVWACDRSRDGQWTGIVYGPPGSELECGVGSPIARRQPYRGNCASGWVASRFLLNVAG